MGKLNNLLCVFSINKNKPRFYFSLFIFLTIFLAMAGDTLAMEVAGRAADIYSGASNSNPMYMAAYNGKLYFQADGNDGSGKELWTYDGTTASLAADISSGSSGSNPAYLTVYNGKLYFSAYTDATGLELWSYDGTTASLEKDIYSGAVGSVPSQLVVYDGKLYFSANVFDGKGTELWAYDGSIASRVADIYSGASSSYPAYLTVFDGKLYFRATGDATHGTELWCYDGSIVSLAADIYEGSESANPGFLAVYNDILYFQANGNDGAGTELWSYDGTTASRAADIYSGFTSGDPRYMQAFDGKLYFTAKGSLMTGYELWSYDGTSTSLAADIWSSFGDSFPQFLAVYNDELYFSADGNDGAGIELWHFFEDAPPEVGTTSPANGVTITPTSSLQVTFNEDMLHDGSDAAADYADNYLLVEAMGDGFQTTTCNDTDFTNDTRISVNTAVYSNNDGEGPYRATLTVNGGIALPAGTYRLLVCGTTSVEDLVGNKLNGGTDTVVDFRVRAQANPDTLPQTGFAPGVITRLPLQPAADQYADLGSLWLEIPSLGVAAPIQGVPVAGGEWDVSWLGDAVGWLEGTAFPTLAGNSVLSAHVYDANGQPGLFKDLDTLKWADKLIVHAYGQAYVYEVRQVEQYVQPHDMTSVLEHQDYPWLTLVTCKGYDEVQDTYLWRVVVQAVQVEID